MSLHVRAGVPMRSRVGRMAARDHMNPLAAQMYRQRAVEAMVRVRVGVAVVICDETGHVLL